MFNPIFTDPNNRLLQSRLARAQELLRAQSYPTREEYQAAVFSAVNAILNLGAAMTPLIPVASEGPAVVGDLTANFTILNNDAADIAAEMLRLEDSAGGLYNLAAATQNSLRQAIREQIYANSGRRYIEDFLFSTNLSSSTATIDYAAGEALLPLISETELTPVFSIGSNSVGAVETGVGPLTDGQPDTAMVWNGTQLELIATFPAATIVNRLEIVLDDYEGLAVTVLQSSPDGTLTEDILLDLGQQSLFMNSASGKYSGSVVLDFPPKQAVQVRMIIQDLVGAAQIALRKVRLTQRSYSSSATVTSMPITAPTGTVHFSATQLTSTPFTSITHQLSYNGVSFIAIQPGDIIPLVSSPFWYRAVLERSSSAFSQSSPLSNPGYDPTQSSNYTLNSISTLPLGNGIIERTFSLDNVTGPIAFSETPLPGTLRVQEGSVILPVTSFAFNENVLSFPTAVTGITLSYQTSALGSTSLAARENYYTPVLSEFRFDKV